ncbi:MAG: phage major capsid protein [Nitrospira sp.]|jgi:HK97 family phage major capsid protein|nr:phage major capsid protein [Nitrospira sp.]MBX3339031.1 phage major capsid protein [Nitrospira sp.]MCC7472706.1 phage major capsid protein [Candidatus Nomurabacteria bacterium]
MNGGIVGLEKSLGEIKVGITNMVMKHDDLEHKQDELSKYVHGRVKAGLKASLPGVDHYPFSFGKALLAISAMNRGQAHLVKEWNVGHELDVMTQATKKAMDTGTAGSGGGYLIPRELMPEIIEMMRAEAQLVQLGVTVLDGLKGSPVEFSKQLAAGSIQWVGQNQIIPKSDPSFGGVQLTPKIAAMRCGFSNLLNILSNPGIEDLIRRDFARVLALEVDRVILEGTGTSNQPMGIAQMPGVQTFALGTDGGVLGWDEVTDLLGKLEDANVPSKKLGLAFHPKVKRLLKKQKVAQYSGDTKGAYTVAPAASDEKLREILGVNFASTTQIATNLTKGSGTGLSRVYAADFSEVVLGMWGGLEIIATNIGGDAWITNSIEARLVANMDVGARHQESIVICSDAKTA